MTPPTLPGEVWRGDVDGPVCVTVDGPVVAAWTWRGDADRWVRTWYESPSIFVAWALSLRADAQRAAEQMRERAATHVIRIGDLPIGTLSRITHEIRALPVPAPTSPPLCSCPDRIAAGTPYPDHRGRWGMDTHVARAWAEARDYDVTQDSEGNDYPMWCEVRGCPWCARPLPDGKAERGKP